MMANIFIILLASLFVCRLVDFLFAYCEAIRKLDPVHSCEVFKTQGCVHVDGALCCMPVCEILKAHRETKP